MYVCNIVHNIFIISSLFFSVCPPSCVCVRVCIYMSAYLRALRPGDTHNYIITDISKLFCSNMVNYYYFLNTKYFILFTRNYI